MRIKELIKEAENISNDDVKRNTLQVLLLLTEDDGDEIKIIQKKINLAMANPTLNNLELLKLTNKP